MPLYILHGADSFSRKEAFDALKRDLDSDGALATNTTTLAAATASLQELTAACDTVPFLGEHRMVVLEGVLAAASGKRGRGKTPDAPGEDAPAEAAAVPGEWAKLGDYVDRMPPSTTLVLVDDAPTIPAWLKGKGSVRTFSPPNERDARGWVAQRARTAGIKLEPGAAQLLGELIGPDTWLLASELDKLNAYTNGAAIRQDDVRKLVSRAKESKGYELSEAIIEGSPLKAMRLVHELIEDGQNWSPILATVAGRYRRIAVAKAMTEAGASGSAIAAKTGQKPGYGLDRLLEQAGRVSWQAIRFAYGRIVEADLDVKARSMEDRLALELCVQDLADAARSRNGGPRGTRQSGATARAR